MLNLLFSLILFLGIVCDLGAQVNLNDLYLVSEINTDSIIIHDIKILGNEKTESETILRELKTIPGIVTSKAQLIADEKRVFSLGLFSDVKFYIRQENEKNYLLIFVRESWYIWPVPFIDIIDRDWKKLTYGLNLSIQNLTGKNDKLSLGISLGYDPRFDFNYFHPWIDKKYDLSFFYKFSFQKRKNKSLLANMDSENYDEKYILNEVGLGKRFDLYNTFNIHLGFEYVQVPEYLPLRTISESGIDRSIIFQADYILDTRDFTAYPRKGTNLVLSLRKIGLGESESNYNVFALELKQIVSYKNFILFFRNYTRNLSGNVLPYYSNSFIGYKERIRGHFNQVYEAHSMNVATFELRYPLIEQFLFYFDLLGIPKSLTTYNFSIDFHFFFDSGFMWNNYDIIRNNKSINGAGFGFSILVLPYRAINFEIEFNSQKKAEFIIDLNNPF